MADNDTTDNGDEEEPEENTRVDAVLSKLESSGDADEVRTAVARIGTGPHGPSAEPTSEPVSTDEQPAERPLVAASLKATIELDDARREVLDEVRREVVDDGWGSPNEDGSRTNSRALRLPDGEVTGAGRAGEALVEGPSEDADAPRLICIQGPDLGREFVLHGRDVAIGRGQDNDVVLNDPSVSRVHCRILLDEGSYTATDQRSGNGTIVNGRRIERQSLKSGTTIKMGQSVLRFVEMGDVIKSTETAEHRAEEERQQSRIVESPVTQARGRVTRPAAPSRSTATKWALGILAGAVILAATIIFIGVFGRGAQEIGRTPHEIASTALSDADLALRAKNFDVARQNYTKAKTALPDDPRGAMGLERLDREQRGLLAMSQATKLALAGAFADAYLQLQSVPKDTVFSAESTAARLEVERALQLRLHDADAETLAAALLPVVPDDAPIKAELRRLVARKKSQVAPPPAPQQHEAAPPPPQPHPAKPDAGLAKRALDAFTGGRMDEALDVLGGDNLDDNALALKNKILKFQDVYQAAQTSTNEAQLKKVLAFESKIAQGKSSYAVQLRLTVAGLMVDAGVKAMNDHRASDAYRSFKDALQMNPDQPVAKRKIGELQSQARDIFNQGYILKDSDRAAARDKWTKVLGMVPADDEIYQKAKKWLEQTK